MNFITATYTDVGVKKDTNQDSMLVMQADTDYGRVLLASMCDGMGGLAKGEVASATMVLSMRKWFMERLHVILNDGGINRSTLWEEWKKLIDDTSRKIMDYGDQVHVSSIGTTIVTLLIVNEDYFVMNVGDSRLYVLENTIYQLTKDQSFIQSEIDAGRMTYEEAFNSPQRNVLLQCIGASRIITPDFSFGKTHPGQVFMLCSDGFRHVITPQEFYNAFNPKVTVRSDVMVEKMKEITELNKQRNEDDNISAILVRTL